MEIMRPSKEMKGWLTVAKEAASLAGSFLLKRRGARVRVNAEEGRDVKLSADVESESIIISYLRQRSDFSVLSEESGWHEGKDGTFTWIIDPLDGSFNYMRGIPLCCVSIGLWQADTPVLGVVYEFNRSEIFFGIAKKGAWLNDSPIGVSRTTKKEKAVLCTGFPVNTDFSKKNLEDYAKGVRFYKKTRLFGSAALSIAYVACGRADAYYENDIMLWDVAGAIPVLLGAGGKVNMKRSFKRYAYYIHTSNGRL